MPYRDRCPKCGAVRVDRQIGLEPTVDAYVAKMVAVFAEVRRVLHPTGCLFLNLGDCYVDKQLQGVPWRVAFALQADGWWLRSAITLVKVAPMPESVTDRPTSATEMLFLLSKASRYYYDADAVRERAEYGYCEGGMRASGRYLNQRRFQDNSTAPSPSTTVTPGDGGTRNLRNWWPISPEPYAGAHFAVFPTELPRRAILAGSSAHGVCPACGAPWRRCVEREPGFQAVRVYDGGLRGRRTGKALDADYRGVGYTRSETTGWSPACTHGLDPRPALVLDPFAGSGTTLLVALRHGRRAFGFDLSPTYCDLARKRITDDAPLLNGQPDAPREPEAAQLGLWQEAAG
jgi:DNA modification methylase